MMPIPQITVKALNITCLHRLAHAMLGTCLGPGAMGAFSQACAPWVDLPPGRFQLFCALSNHDVLGMRAPVRVR